MARDWNYFAPFGSIWAHWGLMGPYRALKSDHWGHGSVHAKFQPVASHGDPFRANLVPSTLGQVLGTKYLVPSTWYQVLGTKYLVPSGTKYLVLSTWYQVLGTKYLVLIMIMSPFLISQFDRVQTTLFEYFIFSRHRIG